MNYKVFYEAMKILEKYMASDSEVYIYEGSIYFGTAKEVSDDDAKLLEDLFFVYEYDAWRTNIC